MVIDKNFSTRCLVTSLQSRASFHLNILISPPISLSHPSCCSRLLLPDDPYEAPPASDLPSLTRLMGTLNLSCSRPRRSNYDSRALVKNPSLQRRRKLRSSTDPRRRRNPWPRPHPRGKFPLWIELLGRRKRRDKRPLLPQPPLPERVLRKTSGCEIHLDGVSLSTRGTSTHSFLKPTSSSVPPHSLTCFISAW